MMKNFLYWLTGYLRVRIICGDRGEPYLERYRLGACGGLTFYIHRFVASDPDRGIHSHPWSRSVSLVLSGQYREIRHGRTRTLVAPALNIIRGEDFHRILLDEGKQAWSLFVHGQRTKGWGFLRAGVYYPHDESADDHSSRDWWKQAVTGRAHRAGGGLP